MLPIADMIIGVFQGVIKPVLDKIIPDAKDRLEAEQAIMQAFNKVGQDMRDLLKIDAASSDKFQSRWRPALGWVCVLSYTWTFFVQPFTVFCLKVFGSTIDPATLPVLDNTELSGLLFALLGIGAMRSYDKSQSAKNGKS